MKRILFNHRFNRQTRCATALLASIVVVGSVGGAARAQASQTPVAPTAAVKPQKLDYKLTTLANGLKVVTLEDHHAPVITLQIWYHVGSADEASGKFGFAHMFEHLMFKGSAHVGPEEHARYVEQIGGDYNANTYFDRTLFFETVPSNAMDRVLWLEADRMASLTVDEKNMKSERDVVKEEHRMDVENQPYGRLLEEVQAMVFPKADPYAHTTIGVMEDLDRASLADVRAFHNRYYKPDNATLVLVGDFKAPEALARIRQNFASIPRSTEPFIRYPATPDVQTEPHRATFEDKLAPLPAVGVAYRVPAASSPDSPVLDVISQILSQGQSSRMYRSLVRDKQLAVEAQGDNMSLKLGGLFFFFAVANAGKPPADLEKALVEQVDLMRTTQVTDQELAKAKNQALTAKVFGTLSTEQKASELGQADLDFGSPAEANRELDKLNAVTAADVQRVAQKYFAPERSNVFYVLPPAKSSPAAGAAKESK